MKTANCSQMRAFDSATINDHNIPGVELMDRAGLGVARCVKRIMSISEPKLSRTIMIAGKGNNGGDVFAAARYLHEWHIEIEVRLTCHASDISGDAYYHFEKMRALHIAIREMADESDWSEINTIHSDSGCVLVDGILGTGISGSSRGTAAAAIRYINRHSLHSIVVAVDIPSGLNADTGEPGGDTVLADVTVTMGLPKRGFAEQSAIEYIGSLEIVDIGIPESLLMNHASDVEIIALSDFSGAFPKRKRLTHKGTYGHVLVIAGAAGYAGAAGMTTRACCRSGAGLVTALVPANIAPIVSSMAPEAMVHPGAETNIGSLSFNCLELWLKKITNFNAIVVGPGMTPHEATNSIVRRILSSAEAPIVMDADALNSCPSLLSLLRRRNMPSIITPHPGEMARLLDRNVNYIQQDRIGSAQAAAEKGKTIVVLKGAGTVVAQSGRTPSVNLTGNPGMATGGTGDILAGMIGGFLAQGINPHTAACAAVNLHGRAGDTAALRGSQITMTAYDLLAELPLLLREISGR
ncbi:MAG: NAD(P)H-hydrate dehydratase [Lentisphaerae bacterium]|nr:NAD(P)H-hydrate dehydratase [Lentisphaerota bacterium]